MDFSLGTGNELDYYLRQYSFPNSHLEYPITSDSPEQIEQFFNQLKDQHLTKIQELQRRLQNCITVYQDVQKNMDASRSRIKQNKQSLNIQRYEDLLECNFKQIEWTKSSRVFSIQPNQKRKTLQKIQEDLHFFEDQICQTNQIQQKMLQNIEYQIQNTSKQIHHQLEHKFTSIRSSTTNLQNALESAQSESTDKFSNLENYLHNSQQNLTQLVSLKIQTLQQQLSELQRCTSA